MPVGEHRNDDAADDRADALSRSDRPGHAGAAAVLGAQVDGDQADERNDRQVVEHQQRDAVEAAGGRAQGAPSSDQSIEDRAVATGRPELAADQRHGYGQDHERCCVEADRPRRADQQHERRCRAMGPMMRPLFQE